MPHYCSVCGCVSLAYGKAALVLTAFGDSWTVTDYTLLPHFPQNFAPALTGSPQEGHTGAGEVAGSAAVAAITAPQEPQNFARALTGLPQAGQVRPPLDEGTETVEVVDGPVSGTVVDRVFFTASSTFACTAAFASPVTRSTAWSAAACTVC